MLKRYQVLLPDWLGEHIRYYVDKYGISFSEGIRAEVCSAILATVPKQFPEYKPGISLEEVIGIIEKMQKQEMKKQDAKRLLSKVYFEARKAAEYRMAKAKEKTKK